MGQITATRNLVATKVVRHAGQLPPSNLSVFFLAGLPVPRTPPPPPITPTPPTTTTTTTTTTPLPRSTPSTTTKQSTTTTTVATTPSSTTKVPVRPITDRVPTTTTLSLRTPTTTTTSATLRPTPNGAMVVVDSNKNATGKKMQYVIDRSRYYYSHLVAARGRGSR